MKNLNVYMILIIGIFLTMVGCAGKSVEVNPNTEKDMQAQINKNLNEIWQSSVIANGSASALTAASAASSDTSEMVVGVWRFNHPLEGTPLQCVTEQIFQSNGAYSGMTQCGPYAMQRSGEWSMPDNNTIRVSLRDGQLIRWDSWKFKMLDRDQMALGDGRVIAYRVK